MRSSSRTALATIATALCLSLGGDAQAQTRSITNQLVVHLSFDSTMNDDSGRANHATYVGNAGLVAQPETPTYVAGKLGQAFVCNTYADASLIEYATLGYPDDLKFGTDTDFSIAFWINTLSANVANDCAYIANRNWNSSSSLGWGVFAQGGLPTVRVHYTTTATGTQKLSVRPPTPGGENLYDGGWHHLAVVCTRGVNVKSYVDGVLENTTAYAASANTLDTDDLGEAVNIGQDGTGTYTQGSGGNPPANPGSAFLKNAAVDDVGIWRRALTDLEVAAIYNFALKGTNLFNVPDIHTPVVTAFAPPNSASGVSPYIPVNATIVDQDTVVNTASIQLLVDGQPVAFTLLNTPPTHTLAYTQPFLSAPNSLHTNKLIFADNAANPARVTNTAVYTIIGWSNIYLPPPLYLENFDEVTPATDAPANYPVDIAGNYPIGWSVTNCSSLFGFWDLNAPQSDAYANWQTVPIDVITGHFNYGVRILNFASPLFINGALVTNAMGTNNIVFAASDQRNNGPQADYLFTRDYDLTGQSNIWVAYNNMYSQENGQLGAVEYSIDQGATWLPVVYMIDPRSAVITNGVADATATLTNLFARIPQNNCSDDPSSTFYGQYIGVSSNLWPTLAPYISLRAGSDHITSHTLEKYRLPAADGQAHVRFRFAFAGNDYWDWGFDDFGLYSITNTPPQITSITQTANNLTIHWNGTGPNSASGLQKNSSVNSPNTWINIPATIGLTAYSEAISAVSTNTVYYRVVRY